MIVCPTSLVSNWCAPPLPRRRSVRLRVLRRWATDTPQTARPRRRDSECEKWLKGRCKTMPLAETSRTEVISSVKNFLSPRCQQQARRACTASRSLPLPAPYLLSRPDLPSPQVLILSYETFRIHSALLTKPGTCDLLICDEAHRLKNDETLTNKARPVGSAPCREISTEADRGG